MWLRRFWFGIGVFAVAFSGSAMALADQPPAASAQPDLPALVERLGAASAADREAATQQLLHCGLLAKQALLAALGSSDLERRWRATSILEQIESDDRERRLQSFLRRAAQGAVEEGPPGWKQYSDALGPLAHRGVFAEMSRAEPDLMAALSDGPRELTAQFNSRCNAQTVELPWPQALHDAGDASVGSVAALLLAGASHGVVVEDQSALHVMRLVYRESFRAAAFRGPMGPALSALVGKWALKNDEGARAPQSLRMASDYELPETVDLATAILGKPKTPPALCVQALIALGQFGDADDLPFLAARFADARVLDDSRQRASKTPRQRPPVEVRNVALAVAVRLTNQSVRSYGFDRLEIDGRLFRAVAPGAFSFADEARRDAAFQRWEEWSRNRGNSSIQ